MKSEPIHPWRWRLLAIWIIVFSVLTFWLIRDGRTRDQQIQNNRVSSCQRTYEGVREVFKPFLPKSTDKITTKQRHDLLLFNKTIDRLKRNCVNQIQSPPNK